jgi:hypothetical protein
VLAEPWLLKGIRRKRLRELLELVPDTDKADAA